MKRCPLTLPFSGCLLWAVVELLAGCTSTSSEKVDAGKRKYCDAYCADGSPDRAGSDGRIDLYGSADLSSLMLDSTWDNGSGDTPVPLIDSSTPDGASSPLDSSFDNRTIAGETSGAGGAGGAGGSGGTGGSVATGGAMADVRPDSTPDTTDARPDSQPDSSDGTLDTPPDTTDIRPDAVDVPLDTTDAPSDLSGVDALSSLDLSIGQDSATQPDGGARSCIGENTRFADKWNPTVVSIATGTDGVLWAAGNIGCPSSGCDPNPDPELGIKALGKSDIFLAKVAAGTGAIEAAFSYGNSSSDNQNVAGVAVALNGNIGIIGSFAAGEIDFTAKHSDDTAAVAGVDYLQTSDPSGFYAVFDSNGVPVGTASSPSSATVYVYNGALLSIASNPGQNAFAICGKSNDLSDLVSNLPTTSMDNYGGGMDIVVAKIDHTGKVLWARQFGGAGDQICQSVTVDNNGDVIIAGNYNGTLSFDTFSLPTVSNISVALLYVAKLNGSTGSVISAATWGTAGRIIPYGLTVDANSNIIVAGSLGGNIDFGSGIAITDLGFTDAFVTKLKSSLVPLWAKAFGDVANDQRAMSVATSSSGDVYVAGLFVGSLGAMNLSSYGPTGGTNLDVFVAELASADGSVLCTPEHYGAVDGTRKSASITVARAAADSLADAVTIAGTFSSSLGPTINLSTGDPNVSASFVARLSP